MAHYSPEQWARRAQAISIIFEDFGRLQQGDDMPPDTADQRFGPMVAREISDFEIAIKAFHSRFSHYTSTYQKTPRSFLRLVAPNAGEGETNYQYYDFGKYGLSHLTYRGISERGTVILGEQLDIFDPKRAPYRPQTNLRRANCDRPGRTIGQLIPDVSTALPAHLLYDVHVHLQMLTEPTPSADLPTLRVIPSAPDELDQ